MDINKAIKKQKNAYLRFMLLMCFIFLLLPFALILSGKSNLLLITYLIVNEVLILAVFFASINTGFLKFTYENNKIRLKLDVFSEKVTINCDKVSIIHVENKIEEKNDFDIILIASSNFRSKKFKKVDEDFLKRYIALSSEYRRLKNLYPSICFYYIKITRGKMLKYKLLDTIYKGCMQTIYTEKAIEKIKEFRNE